MPRVLLSIALLVFLTNAGFCQVNQQMIDRVAAGEVTEAKASWWGFDEHDATDALQAAINSGAPKLIVENMGTPWIVRPIALASNQEIVFEDGCEIVAKRGEFKSTTGILLSARNVKNLVLRGNATVVRMWREDYANPDLYEKAEWRHCLSICGCKNVSVSGLVLQDSGGDGIYIGVGSGGSTNHDIAIKDVVCERNYRQGISVISANGLLIEDTIMRDTAGTPPEAGIDFEPNAPTEQLSDIVMRNCLTENNAGSGYKFALPYLNAQSEPISVRIEGSRSVDDQDSAVQLATNGTVASACRGLIEFEDCEFEGALKGGVWMAKPAAQGLLRLIDCTVSDCALEEPERSPVTISSRSGYFEPVGGLELRGLVVRDPLERTPVGESGGMPVGNVSGTVIVVDADGQRSEIELTQEQLALWMPAASLKQLPLIDIEGMAFAPADVQAPAVVRAPATEPADWPIIRGRGTYKLWAAQGDTVDLLVRQMQVGNYGGRAMPVIVTGPGGEEVHRGEVDFKSEAEMSFVAPEEGTYTVEGNAGGNRFSVAECSHPIGVIGAHGTIHLIRSACALQVYVPAGVTEFAVRVSGEGRGEGIRASLLDPAGEVFGERDNQVGTHQFEVTLDEPSEGQVWTLRLDAPSAVAWEDHYVDIRGVPPILTPVGVTPLVPVNQ